MLFHELSEVEKYFEDMGFKVLHFKHKFVVDTYILVMNSNYDIKDRLYIEINYTTSRDAEYELIYLPMIIDVHTCPEEFALNFEADPQNNMDKLNTVTDQFDFENIPSEIANQYTNEFEMFLNYIRQTSDLNFKTKVHEKKVYDKKVMGLKILNMNLLDDMFDAVSYSEIENPKGYVEKNEVFVKAAAFVSAQKHPYTVIATVYDNGKYKYKIVNNAGGSVHTSSKMDDRQIFIDDFQNIIKTI